MRGAQALAAALAVVCAVGCEFVAGLTGHPGLWELDGGAGSTMGASSGTSTTSSTSSSGGTGGGAVLDGQIVVMGLTNPTSLAVDATNVYWTDGTEGTVTQADIATGTPMQIASGESAPAGLVIDSMSDLYWVEPSAGNVRVAYQGQSASVYAGGQAGPNAVVGGTTTEVYWTTQGTSPQGGAVMDLPVPAMPPQTVIGLPGPVERIALGGHYIAYSSGGTLYSADVSLGSPSSILLSDGNPAIGGIAADAMFAYWTDGMSSVAKVPLAMGAPTVLASQQANPSDVAFDILYVYWINQGTTAGSGTVMKAPLNVGTPIPLATGQVAPRGLFVTLTDVYWISGAKNQGAIKRLPK